LCVQAAFGSGGFILVKNAFACHAIDHRNCQSKRLVGFLFIAAFNGFIGVFDKGANFGAVTSVLNAAVFRLFCAFFCLR